MSVADERERILVVDDAPDLPDVAEPGQVENLERRAVGVDEGKIERMQVGRHVAHLPRAGERSDGRVATVDDSRLLSVCRKRDGNERGNSEKGSAKPSCPMTGPKVRAIAHGHTSPRRGRER